MTRAVLDERANRAMLHSRVLRACCVVALTVLAPAEVRAADRYEVIIERDVQAKMRDGITLRSDVCRPKTDGKFPVLLTRTPYDKKRDADICLKWAARGYMVVAQDVRGRYASEGEWYPFKNESQDGYDTGGSAASSFSPRLPVRLIWREFPPTLRRPTITTAGPIRAARSSNGSTNRGRRDWRKTPWNAAHNRAATRSAGHKSCHYGLIPCAKHLRRRDWLPISPTGWRTRTMTTFGSAGLSKITTRRFKFPSSPRA